MNKLYLPIYDAVISYPSDWTFLKITYFEDRVEIDFKEKLYVVRVNSILGNIRRIKTEEFPARGIEVNNPPQEVIIPKDDVEIEEEVPQEEKKNVRLGKKS